MKSLLLHVFTSLVATDPGSLGCSDVAATIVARELHALTRWVGESSSFAKSALRDAPIRHTAPCTWCRSSKRTSEPCQDQYQHGESLPATLMLWLRSAKAPGWSLPEPTACVSLQLEFKLKFKACFSLSAREHGRCISCKHQTRPCIPVCD